MKLQTIQLSHSHKIQLHELYFTCYVIIAVIIVISTLGFNGFVQKILLSVLYCYDSIRITSLKKLPHVLDIHVHVCVLMYRQFMLPFLPSTRHPIIYTHV